MNRHFVLVLVCFILSIISGFAQNLKPNYSKNSIQIGKTGYYFDRENPFGFERVLFYSGSQGKKFLLYWPYIGYTRKIAPNFGMGVSIEQYRGCYVCKDFNKWPPLLFKIETRVFKYLQFNLLYEYLLGKKWNLLLRGGIGYRWALEGQSWTIGYVDHGSWRETHGYGKSFHEWGVGGAIEVKYKFYNQFSLSVKGEYFSFPARPVRHFGAGAYIGYDF